MWKPIKVAIQLSRFFVAVLVLMLVACAYFFQEKGYTRASVYGKAAASPESWYYSVWLKEDSCASSTRRLKPHFLDIVWYQADSMYDAQTGKRLAGLWVFPHTIILAKGNESDPLVVGHEILHDLLPGVPHDDFRFMECNPILRPGVVTGDLYGK